MNDNHRSARAAKEAEAAQAGEEQPPSPEPTTRTDTSAGGYRLAMTKLLVYGLLMVLLFWTVSLWLFGSYYKMTGHLHQLDCLAVDLDGGAVGAALMSAVAQYNGRTTSLHYRIRNASSTIFQQTRQEVWDGDVWCAVIANEGATARFQAAIAPGSATTASYDPALAYTYIGVQARYPTVWSSLILTDITRVLLSASHAFATQTVAPILANATAGQFTPIQLNILLNPVSSTFLNLAPFQFSNTPLLNTIGMLLPQLLQSFFLLGLDGIWAASGLYRLSFGRVVRDRFAVAVAWTVLTGLCVTGWTVAWRESWTFPAENFFALWVVIWVFALITFDLFDTMIAFVPPQFVALPIIGWSILTIASTASPIELDQQFFHVHWAFPGHAVWLTQTVVYGRGAGASRWLHVTLPILTAWLVAARGAAIAGMWKHKADYDRSVAHPRAA